MVRGDVDFFEGEGWGAVEFLCGWCLIGLGAVDGLGKKGEGGRRAEGGGRRGR